MDCFGDICKHNNQFDTSLNTLISRFTKCDSNSILISENINLVAKYDITNGLNPIESWSFPQLSPLSLPVIVDSSGGEDNRYLIALQESNSLTKWTFDSNKNKVDKNSFTTKIIALIGFNDCDTIEPILVFENGFCQSMKNAIQTKRNDKNQRFIGTDEVIQFVDAFIDPQFKDYINIFLITKNASNVSKDDLTNDSTVKSIHKLILNRETDDIFEIHNQSVMNNVKHWSLCPHLSSLLAINESNNELILFSLNGKTERQLFKLDMTSIKCVISFATTGMGNICLIGKTIDGNYLLELWETKYGSKLGEIGLPFEPILNDCKVIENHIYITCYKGVLSIPIKTQSVYLSQIVGKITTNDSLHELNLNNQLKQICNDFKSLDDQSVDSIYERFSQITNKINGNIPEDIILQLLNVCSFKLMNSESDALKDMFKKLVSLPFNDVFMISKLKASTISFDQILLSLHLLSDLLPSKSGAIIDWMSVLIDVYMNHFIVNPNEKTIEVIQHINHKIEHFSQFYEQLGDIKTLFDIMMANNNRNVLNNHLPKPKRGQYCIEFLKI